MGAIGLCGSHRTGKTTLARKVGQQINIPFIPTNIGIIFKQYQLKPTDIISTKLKSRIQWDILKQSKKKWRESRDFTTDRTPLDFIAYMLTANIVDVEYINACFKEANLFQTLVLVQPGIPLIHEENKAAMKEVEMEVLNLTIAGLLADEKYSATKIIIPRDMVNLNQRIMHVTKCLESHK